MDEDSTLASARGYCSRRSVNCVIQVVSCRSRCDRGILRASIRKSPAVEIARVRSS